MHWRQWNTIFHMIHQITVIWNRLSLLMVVLICINFLFYLDWFRIFSMNWLNYLRGSHLILGLLWWLLLLLLNLSLIILRILVRGILNLGLIRIIVKIRLLFSIFLLFIVKNHAHFKIHFLETIFILFLIKLVWS